MATTTAPSKPKPHAHMSPSAQKRWTERYDAAFKQAVIDYPDNPAAQRTVALKAANALLAVPAPTSISDVAKLEPWQILSDQTLDVRGISTRFIVTADGRKYSFEVSMEKPAKPAKPARPGAQPPTGEGEPGGPDTE